MSCGELVGVGLPQRFGFAVGKSCVHEQLSGVTCVNGFGYGAGWLASPWLGD